MAASPESDLANAKLVNSAVLPIGALSRVEGVAGKRARDADQAAALPLVKKAKAAPSSLSDASWGSCGAHLDGGHDECSSDCATECCDTEVVIRRYCIIFNEEVPDAYFEGTPPPAVMDIEAAVTQHVASCKSAGLHLVRHEFACGVETYNVHADDAEMWCSLPETAIPCVKAALLGKLESIFEECGFDEC